MEILVLRDTVVTFLKKSLRETQDLLVQTWGQFFFFFAVLVIFAPNICHRKEA